MKVENTDRLNALTNSDATSEFFKCCSAAGWAQSMTKGRPFSSPAQLFTQAKASFEKLQRSDWLEAFSHHPRIGEDLVQLRAKFANTATWAAKEQSGIEKADETELEELRTANRDYFAKFGRVFLICASGLNAQTLLGQLKIRLLNSDSLEWDIACQEQIKITELRLKKLLSETSQLGHSKI